MKKLLVISVVLCGLVYGSVLVAGQTPTGDLKPILNEVTSVLLDENLKSKDHLVERREKIMELIASGFDFREMARRILGRTWQKIETSDQNYFTKLITKLMENVYIGKLEGYSGQAIEFVEETVKGERAQVTTLVENGDQKIPVHYIMQKSESRWMVYDINIEGVSLVRNYQEQFKSILRTEDFKGLVKVLEEKNRSFTQEAQ